jgi:hypothetical protein
MKCETRCIEGESKAKQRLIKRNSVLLREKNNNNNKRKGWGEPE